MAAMTMGPEPEVARFMDAYKYDQQMEDRRQAFGGGTSLPLHSDNYEDKQRQLKDERRREMLQQQEKNFSYTPPKDPYHRFHAKVATGPQHMNNYDSEIEKMTDRYHQKYDEVLYDAEREPRLIEHALREEQPKESAPKESAYYRVGTPEQGLAGIGQYEQQRNERNVQRQQEYNQYMKKQRQLEQQKLDSRHRSPPRPAQAPGPQIDYQAAQEQARADDRRAYQDYMGKYQHPTGVQPKPPINYEENRKVLNEERKREYNELMEKKAKEERYWAARGKPTTPPGGLDLGQYDRNLKETIHQKRKDYAEDLKKQQAEQLRFRALDHAADTSPGFVHYRENERPLVGSPREVNFFMREKEEKDIFRKERMEKKQETSLPIHNDHKASIDDPFHKQYYEVERAKAESKRKYREELLKQQQEHMYLRARQEPEVSVIDRAAQQPDNLASKPPVGPGYRPRDDPTRQTPIYWNEGHRARSPQSLDSEVSRRSRRNANNEVPLAFQTNSYSNRPIPERQNHGQPPRPGEGQRQTDVNKLFPSEGSRNSPPPRSPPRRQQEDRGGRRSPGPVENYGRYSPSRPDRDALMRPQSREKPPSLNLNERPQQQQYDSSSLGIGNSGIEDMRKQGGQQRQKEYNEYIVKKTETEQRKRDEMHHMAMGRPAEVVKNQYYSSENYESYQKDLQRKQGEEYRDFLQKKFQPPPERAGLPLGQYRYEPKRLAMEAERNREYNQVVKKFQPSEGAPGLPIGQYVYEPKRLVMEAERNKEYNDLLQKESPRYRQSQHDGPQGLNIDVHYPERKKAWLEKQRNVEYNKFLEKGQGSRPVSSTRFDQPGKYSDDGRPEAQLRTKPPTPPSRPDQASPNPVRQYSPMRRQQEGVASLSRQQSPSSRNPQPPRSAARHRENLEDDRSDGHERMKMTGQPDQQYQLYGSEGHYGRSEYPDRYSERRLEQGDGYREPGGSITRRDDQIPSTPSQLSLPLGQYDRLRPLFERERNREYNELKNKLTARYRHVPSPETNGMSLDVGRTDSLIPLKERQRNMEYNRLIQTGELGKKLSPRQKAATPPDLQGLPIGQQKYTGMHKAMEYQRNREYNEFLEKKYNKLRDTQSEPDRDKTSFYLGNESMHDEKRRYLEAQRHLEYNEMLRKQNPPSNREMNVPSDVDSGLPIGQQHHEVWKKFLRDQRNKEYNQLVDMKRQVGNRNWNYSQDGILELRGDDAVQTKQRELRSERQQEYLRYMNKIKPPRNQKWPEPEGRGALLVKKGEYDNIRQMYDQQRKHEFREMVNRNQEAGAGQVKPVRAQSEPAPKQNRNINPIVQSLGRYEEIRKQLKDIRKREFHDFLNQHKTDAKRRPLSEVMFPRIAGEETPLVNRMSNYEVDTKKRMKEQRRKDFQDFRQEQLKHVTPRTTVKENLMPHQASAETPIVNYMGHYDEEKRKFLQQRSKEQREYLQKKKQEQHSPYENFVFPTVAVAEKPVVENMGTEVENRKQLLREERRRDYERYQIQQKMKEAPRRHDYIDSAPGPYKGLFSGLGDHGNSKEVLSHQRKQEYNDHLEKSKRRQPGRTARSDEAPHYYSDRGRSPMRNNGAPPPDQYQSHGQPDHYQQMLDEKRREEAHRRRFDDPEYQDRLAQNSRDQQRYQY